MNKLVVSVLITIFSSSAYSVNYDFYIKKIQATDIGHTHFAIYPDLNITDSPCEMTNTTDRFTMTTQVQYSAALAALMAGKKITLQATGSCNSGGLETVSYIMIYSDQ